VSGILEKRKKKSFRYLIIEEVRRRGVVKESLWGKKSFQDIPPSKTVLLYGNTRLARQERKLRKL
jgi:hypothetical protein